MNEVTCDEFFAALYRDPRDIMPSTERPDCTRWLSKDRQEFGVSYPGWRDDGDPNVPKRWFLAAPVAGK